MITYIKEQPMIDSNIYIKYQEMWDIQQAIFLDVLNDLICWVKSIQNISTHFSKEKNRLYLDEVIKDLSEKWLLKTEWMFYYKKTDYVKNKKISSIMDTISKSWISRCSMLRRGIIRILIEHWFINDLWLSLDHFFDEESMINDSFVKVWSNWKKNFNFKLIDTAKKDVPFNKENIRFFIYIEYLKEIRNYYWENQLNDDLNEDSSFRQMLFFTWDYSNLNQLNIKLIQDWEKEIINKYTFQSDKLIINNQEFKPTWDKTKYFLQILSSLFSSKQENKVSIWELNDLYIEKTTEKLEKNLNFLNLNQKNIKTSYMKTLLKQLWKKYINGNFLQIEGSYIYKR